MNEEAPRRRGTAFEQAYHDGAAAAHAEIDRLLASLDEYREMYYRAKLEAEEWHQAYMIETDARTDLQLRVSALPPVWESLAGPPNGAYEQCARDLRQALGDR